MTFEGIQKTARLVRQAAQRYGWLTVSDTRAGTDTRYVEVARGAEMLKLRISDHPPTRDCDLSVSPSQESIEEAEARLAKKPIFTDRAEGVQWLAAMRARLIWLQVQQAEEDGTDADALTQQAEALASRASFLVARRDGRVYTVDEDWLEGVAGGMA